MSPAFIHLRLHTEYSLEDSVVRIPLLVDFSKRLHLPALAITDQMNLFAAVKFYQAMSSAGIKPIFGADVWVIDHVSSQSSPVTLLCQNITGYHRLLQLISRSYLERLDKASLAIQKQWLVENNEGLILLSGGIHGNIGQAILRNDLQQAATHLKAWQSIFKNRFYIELQRMGQKNEEIYIASACQLAYEYHIPVVATHNTCFLQKDDFLAHQARMCIQKGSTLSVETKKHSIYTDEQYLKSTEEMQILFKDIPSALQNSVEIAKRCNVLLALKETHLPNFPVPQKNTAEQYLIEKAKKGLSDRLALQQINPTNTVVSKEIQEQQRLSYFKRLELELDVINKMGFAGYFLIVADFIHWAKSQAVPVGPGRGSGAGSLVAYALNITDLDPIYYGLLFERFLNIERISLPDFDIDFCMEKRDKVIAYVTERYGKKAVAQIITFGTMAARAVVRDVGRVLNYPYRMVDTIAKLVPFEVGMTLEKALSRKDQSTDSLQTRYEKEEEVQTLIDLARKLEGLVRNVGTHAGGVVIAPRALTNYTALYYESGMPYSITQLDKDDLESIGLVKFDFLGLRTLTIIDWALKIINQKLTLHKKPLINIEQLPLQDAKTFALLREGKVTAVFQLESRGIRALLQRLMPDHFDDIVALIALFRPGPLQSGMVEDFIERKQDLAKVKYFHPLLEPILKPTYGVIIYQEQVMQIAQVLAGYSLGQADILRRAMGKKKPLEMAKQRVSFLSGAQKKNINRDFANTMFDLIEKFAGYGFNKSHSVAYALLSYQTAFLKAHHPSEFMAAVLSTEIENTEKLVALIYECRMLCLTVNPPNIHRSHYLFTVDEQGNIEYGLGAVKGVGQAMIEHLLERQKIAGPFQNLFDLCHRIEKEKINRRALEALIYSGSLDCFNETRATLAAQLETAIRSAFQKAVTSSNAQFDLFKAEEMLSIAIQDQVQTNQKNTPLFLMQKEKETLGFYCTHHPICTYDAELKALSLIPVSQIDRQQTQIPMYLAVWLVNIQVKFTKKGSRFVILTVEDMQKRFELKLSSEMYDHYRVQLVKDTLLIIHVEKYQDRISQETRLTCKTFWNVEQMRQTWGKQLCLNIKESTIIEQPQFIASLKSYLKSVPKGATPIVIEYQVDNLCMYITLGTQWNILPTNTLLTALRENFKFSKVYIRY